METLLAILVALGLGSCAAVMILRRAAAAANRRWRAVRDRAGLTARSYVGGPGGDVARLRRDMDRALAASRSALATARSVGAPIGDVPLLLGRLDLAARAVDAELRVLESHADRSRVSAALAGPRSRADAVMSSAADLVDGLLHATGYDAQQLAVLQAECAIEADALRASPNRSPHRRIDGWADPAQGENQLG